MEINVPEGEASTATLLSNAEIHPSKCFLWAANHNVDSYIVPADTEADGLRKNDEASRNKYQMCSKWASMRLY